MKSNKRKGIIGLLITLICIGVFGYFGYDTMDDIKLGLDLAGGVSITYQAVEENPSSEEMSDTIYKLQQRVQNYSTEAEVYQEGSNRINIDIPGVSDANAILEELGKPGSLIFVDESGNTILTGDQVASAKAAIQEKNGQKSYVVSLTFTEEGAKTFADATAKNIGKRIGIIYDGSMVSYPTVNSAITGGECYIDGMQDYDEAENLAATIRIGSLSLELEDLRRAGRPAVLLCFVPASFEVLGMVLLAPRLLGVDVLDAAIMGAVVGAVSPAVIVPRMLRLMEEGYGADKGIPQMILAGASVDIRSRSRSITT